MISTAEWVEDFSAVRYRNERVEYWNQYQHSKIGRCYAENLAHVYRGIIPQGKRVLEVGSGEGDLLASVQPSVGVGVDFSPQMVERAAKRHPELTFLQMDAHELQLAGPFDYIIVSDLTNDLWDVQLVFHQIARLCSPDTRVVVNLYSRLWETPLLAAARLGLCRPSIGKNWLTLEDLDNMLYLANMQVIRSWQEVLCPLPIPLISGICNRYLVKTWPFHWLALTNVVVARLAADARERSATRPSVSVVVPARNEAGNVDQIFRRVPEMGSGTEIIFVEGGSKDDTYGAITRAMARYPERRSSVLQQPGTGKADAVRCGFEHAQGDILMILDADLTVTPEDLLRFYAVLRSGKGEFINGVRLVYPMENHAMRFYNLVANKLFGWIFSWLMGQNVRDTLCGTKVLTRQHYDMIAANRKFFGDFDPFGDFDLLFGAAKLNLKIVDVPIRYRERRYGTTNIQRWRHGWMLLKMVLFGMRRLKFV